ncbi:hypothetical protein [Quatrionicoccus australiensis]|nr:hypothetical protein [Quatrionicoccus australiensis]
MRNFIISLFTARATREAQARAFDWNTKHYNTNRAVAVQSGARY